MNLAAFGASAETPVALVDTLTGGENCGAEGGNREIGGGNDFQLLARLKSL